MVLIKIFLQKEKIALLGTDLDLSRLSAFTLGIVTDVYFLLK